MTLKELSLFSGYGGFSLGLRLAGLEVQTVGYIEIEPYCQEIIKARIKDGLLDDGPVFPDISAFRGEQFRGVVDIITAGFPCQPHSVAGLQQGSDDARNKWPDTLRVIREVAPRYVLLENVSGHLFLESSEDLLAPATLCGWQGNPALTISTCPRQGSGSNVLMSSQMGAESRLGGSSWNRCCKTRWAYLSCST